MADLLAFTRGPSTPDTVERVYRIDPAGIVRAAEALGKLSIAAEAVTPAPVYQARIEFTNAGGSRIWATGIDTDFFAAIMKSIQEAVRLQ